MTLKKRFIKHYLFIATFIGFHISLISDDVSISVDQRIELLSIVQYLHGIKNDIKPPTTTFLDSPYIQDVAEYFSPFKNHPAVALFSEMSAQGFTYDAPFNSMLHLSQPPELNIEIPFTGYLLSRAGGEEKLRMLANALKSFAEESDFKKFFDSHRGSFAQMTRIAAKEIGSSDWIRSMEEYFGCKHDGYHLILAPLLQGSFGPQTKNSEMKTDAYIITGPRTITNGLPVFFNRESIKDLMVHEFGHSFINPVVDRFSDEIDNYSSLYKPIESWMKKQAYNKWNISVTEHLIRAFSIQFLDKKDQTETESVQNEKMQGFFYIEPILDKLKEYESRRSNYPTFQSFFPKFVRLFKKLAKAKLGPDYYRVSFNGTIRSVLYDSQAIVFIVPTNEKNIQAQAKIHQYVKKVHDWFCIDCRTMTDAEALKTDLTDNAVMAYGTPSGNLWLAKFFSQLPIRIKSATSVDFDGETFNGDHLRIISAWPNPQNPTRGVVIYTALDADDVAGLNGIPHGMTDYLVANGADVMKIANYKKPIIK